MGDVIPFPSHGIREIDLTTVTITLSPGSARCGLAIDTDGTVTGPVDLSSN